MIKLRHLAVLASLASAPLAAQELPDLGDEILADARGMVDRHSVSTTTGCSVPIPARWNAPSWEQDAAMRRRVAFEQCLQRAYDREYDRLERLSYRIGELRADYPDLDWSEVDWALDSKWAELDAVDSKIATQQQWADTATRILDTFTGPGAPLDSSPLNPARNPYAYPVYGGYRPNSSVSAPGVP